MSDTSSKRERLEKLINDCHRYATEFFHGAGMIFVHTDKLYGRGCYPLYPRENELSACFNYHSRTGRAARAIMMVEGPRESLDSEVGAAAQWALGELARLAPEEMTGVTVGGRLADDDAWKQGVVLLAQMADGASPPLQSSRRCYWVIQQPESREPGLAAQPVEYPIELIAGAPKGSLPPDSIPIEAWLHWRKHPDAQWVMRWRDLFGAIEMAAGVPCEDLASDDMGQVGEEDAETTDTPRALTRNEIAVLEAMAKLDQAELASAVKIEEIMDPTSKLSEKTILKIVGRLIEMGFAERPQGSRQGARVTSSGRRQLRKITD